MRCLSLARRLSTSSFESSFIVGPGMGDTVPSFEHSGFEVLDLAHDFREGDFLERIPDGTDLLVVDHYQLGLDFEVACREKVKRILVIDDLANRAHDCDVLMDSTLGRTRNDYLGLIPQDCLTLLGPRFALLREEFSRIRAETLRHRRERNGLERILVSMGLSDSAGAARLCMKALKRTGLPLDVEIFLGLNCTSYEDLLFEADSCGYHVADFNTDMPAAMARADLALGAGGTTSWERCCLGLPSLMMILAENQELTARSLHEKGAAVNLGRSGEILEEDMAAVIKRLSKDNGELRALSEKAASLCDGMGTLRVCLYLASPQKAKDGRDVRLRLSEPTDMDVVFRWQTAPGARRFSRVPRPPTRDEHREWFESIMMDSTRILTIITHDHRDAGLLRLDPFGNDGLEVSILVAEEFRGLGIGEGALCFASTFWPHIPMHAEILPGNDASKRIFLSAGFKRREGNMYELPPRA